MATRRIRHWKHGWIPVSPEAKAYAAGKGPKPGTQKLAATKSYSKMTDADKVKAAEIMFGTDSAEHKAAQKKYGQTGKTSRIAEKMKVAETDGVTFVTYKAKEYDTGDGAGEPYEFTPAQRTEIAKTVNEVRQHFPRLKPITIVGVHDDDNMGVTEWDGRRISLAANLFNHENLQAARTNMGPHGSIVATSPGADTDDAAFRRGVIVHELGHALEMQRGDTSRDVGNSIAFEDITPRKLGYTHKDLPPGAPDSLLDRTAPRWPFDTLDRKSAYAGSNQWEWFAEAFADGYLNGETGPGGRRVTESGLRAVAKMRELYGG